MLPGKIEADNAQATHAAGGLIFTEAEIEEFEYLAKEAEFDWDQSKLKTIEA